MKNVFWGFLAVLFLMGCRAKKNVAPIAKVEPLRYTHVVENYQTNSFAAANIKTIKIDSKAACQIGEKNFNLGLSFRIAKGEKVWVSADYFGIPVVKILFEPERVRYYNKIDHSFFDGSYSLIKDRTGVEVNYQMLESLLLGDILIDINQFAYTIEMLSDAYLIHDVIRIDTTKDILIYPNTFRVKSQTIEKKLANALFMVQYPKYNVFEGFMMPVELEVKAINETKETKLYISYEKVEVNKELSFPYKIPQDCTNELVLKTAE